MSESKRVRKSKSHQSSRSKSKSRTSSFQQRPLETHLLSSNFEKFRWRHLERLKVEDCRNEIQRRMILKCTDTLKLVEFRGHTNFKNLKLILSSCGELEVVIFCDISLNNYIQDADTSAPPSRLYHLKTIKFLGMGQLTMNELHVLTHLHDRIEFKTLNTISLLTERTDGDRTNQSNIFNDRVSPIILAMFLNKNWTFLKNLEITRSDVTLYDDQGPKIVNIQLEKFECDMSGLGFDKVLNSQTELQVLIATNKKLMPLGFQTVLNAIRRNGPTLKTIRIQYSVMLISSSRHTSSEQEKEEDLEPLIHDCKIYKYCRKLKKLEINVSQEQEPELPRSIRIKPGIIANAQYFPPTLKALTVRFDAISDKDMKSFATSLSAFENLSYLLFLGNRENPYRMKLSWILTLIDLPKVQMFQFHHAKMDDMKSVEAFRKSSGLSGNLKVARDLCIYTRKSKGRDSRSRSSKL